MYLSKDKSKLKLFLAGLKIENFSRRWNFFTLKMKFLKKEAIAFVTFSNSNLIFPNKNAIQLLRGRGAVPFAICFGAGYRIPFTSAYIDATINPSSGYRVGNGLKTVT